MTGSVERRPINFSSGYFCELYFVYICVALVLRKSDFQVLFCSVSTDRRALLREQEHGCEDERGSTEGATKGRCRDDPSS